MVGCPDTLTTPNVGQMTACQQRWVVDSTNKLACDVFLLQFLDVLSRRNIPDPNSIRDLPPKRQRGVSRKLTHGMHTPRSYHHNPRAL